MQSSGLQFRLGRWNEEPMNRTPSRRWMVSALASTVARASSPWCPLTVARASSPWCPLCLLIALAGMAGEPPSDKVPLVLELPKPRFIGTPISLKTANLEKPRSGRRPDLYVPAGVANVALNKPVTASDTEPTLGELKQVTDGDKDGVEGSYVEIGPGKQYFQVDLKERHRIFAIVVWHYHAQARVYRDVVVQLSDDPAFSGNVRTVYNNDHDNSSGFGAGEDKEFIDSHEGLLIDAKGAEARYVRSYGNGNTENDLNHCTEVEVYGKKAGAP